MEVEVIADCSLSHKLQCHVLPAHSSSLQGCRIVSSSYKVLTRNRRQTLEGRAQCFLSEDLFRLPSWFIRSTNQNYR